MSSNASCIYNLFFLYRKAGWQELLEIGSFSALAADPNANAQVCILIQLQTTTDQKEPKRDPTLFQKWQI